MKMQLLIVLSLMLGLTGCANMNQQKEEEAKQLALKKKHQQACNQSDMLIANLTVPPEQRSYYLKMGTPCDYE